MCNFQAERNSQEYALSLALVVESILFRPPACRFGQSGCDEWPLHLVWVRSRDAKGYPVGPRRETIKLSDAAVGRSLRSVRDSQQCADLRTSA